METYILDTTLTITQHLKIFDLFYRDLKVITQTLLIVLMVLLIVAHIRTLY